MKRDPRSDSADRDWQAVERLSSIVLEQMNSRHNANNSLFLSALPHQRSEATVGRGAGFGLHLSLLTGASRHQQEDGSAIVCSSLQLPFQDAVFRSVTLFHVLQSGSEAELGEACRVLTPTGRLHIVGLQQRWPVPHPSPAPMRMRTAALFRRLTVLGLIVEHIEAAGLLGTRRPARALGRWSSLFLPLTDVVLIRARRRDTPLSPRLRLKDIPAGAAPSALIAGGRM